jgi:hypothetical protein
MTILRVMISRHIIQGDVQNGQEKFEIRIRQITTPNHQIEIGVVDFDVTGI